MSARNYYIMQSAVAPMQSELPCYTPLTNHRTEVHTVPLVMAADYAAMEAERDHLKACQENAQLHITGLVAERNAALKQRDKLAWLLRHASSVLGSQGWDALTHEIDAALAELTP